MAPFPVFAKDFKYSTLAVAAGVASLEQLDGGGMLYSAHLREDWCIGVGKCHSFFFLVMARENTHRQSARIPHMVFSSLANLTALLQSRTEAA